MTGEYSLMEIEPNPFDAETNIPYALSRHSHVTVQIVDSKGKLVRNLVQEFNDPGLHAVCWDGTDETGRSVTTGVYQCRMIAQSASGRAFLQSRCIERITDHRKGNPEVSD